MIRDRLQEKCVVKSKLITSQDRTENNLEPVEVKDDITLLNIFSISWS